MNGKVLLENKIADNLIKGNAGEARESGRESKVRQSTMENAENRELFDIRDRDLFHTMT